MVQYACGLHGKYRPSSIIEDQILVYIVPDRDGSKEPILRSAASLLLPCTGSFTGVPLGR